MAQFFRKMIYRRSLARFSPFQWWEILKAVFKMSKLNRYQEPLNLEIHEKRVITKFYLPRNSIRHPSTFSLCSLQALSCYMFHMISGSLARILLRVSGKYSKKGKLKMCSGSVQFQPVCSTYIVIIGVKALFKLSSCQLCYRCN